MSEGCLIYGAMQRALEYTNKPWIRQSFLPYGMFYIPKKLYQDGLPHNPIHSLSDEIERLHFACCADSIICVEQALVVLYFLKNCLACT